MSISVNNLKINNKTVNSGDTVRVPLGSVLINWDYSSTTPALKQVSYEIRIGTSNLNWGTSSYVADLIRQPYMLDKAQFWRLKRKFIDRGKSYYGQIRLKNSAQEESEWVKFKFTINRLPFLTGVKIEPENPSDDSSLELKYNKPFDNFNINTKWYRNGVHYKQFDGYSQISKEYLRLGDKWFVEVTPFDDLENGVTETSKTILVSKKSPTVDSLIILPINPNINDILEASYIAKDNNTNNILLNDKSIIKWYVNNLLIESATNSRFVRFALKPKDEVYFTVTASDGFLEGNTLASKTVVIQDGGFKTINTKVDGISNNLFVSTVNPTIQWDVVSPPNRSSRYASIKIGTVQGADNIYKTIIETYDNKFSVPDNIIKRGIDYHVSVSSSDRDDSFENWDFTSFRVNGNLWEKEVNNDVGWTIEASLKVSNSSQYGRISLADGSRFCELRFYKDFIQLLAGNNNVRTFDVNLLTVNNIIITGKKNSIKIFINNKIAIDGSDLFTNFSSDRFIEIGSSAENDSVLYLSRLLYTVEGSYEPGSDVYSKINVEKFIDFTGKIISDVAFYNGDIILSANSINGSESAEIYKVSETKKPINVSVENIDGNVLKVNSIYSSPNDKTIYASHSAGVSKFSNYYINKYDSETNFAFGTNASQNLWDLTGTTPFVAESYIQEGLVIDTTVSNRQVSDYKEIYVLTQTSAIGIVSVYETQIGEGFDIEIKDNFLTIYLQRNSSVVYSTSLVNKSVNDIIDELKALTSSNYYFFSLYFEIFTINNVGTQSASRLNPISKKRVFPSIELSGKYQIVDPYTLNEYGSVSTGKWYYSHNKNGTPWFERVDNAKGWTVDFGLRVDSVEDSDTPAKTSSPKGIGVYVNDGTFCENLWFFPQEIYFENAKKIFTYDTTLMTDYRLIGKDNKIKLYGKKSSDVSYEQIAESTFSLNATNQGNAGKPSVVADKNKNLHAVWHDDGKGLNRRQVYYALFDFAKNAWSEPELIVSDSFSNSDPDIAVDSAGNVYVVYATTKTDYTDISVITKNSYGWSDPYLLTSNLFDSFAPKICIDENNNAHVVWEDHRTVQPQIFYCRRNASDGQWESASFGKQDIQVSAEPVGAKRPAICSQGSSVYVSWTAFNQNGSSSIKMAYYNAGEGTWFSSGQGGFDFNVSGISSESADHSSIVIDLKGNVVAVWDDIINYNYQIFGRFVNPRLSFGTVVEQLTKGDFDSRNPKCGLDLSSGNVYVVFEKEQEKILSEYSPYVLRNDDISFNINSIFLLRWNARTQAWQSSNQTAPNYYAPFDMKLEFPSVRYTYKPAIPKYFSENMHILFENLEVSQNTTLEKDKYFSQIRDVTYNFIFTPIYSVINDENNEREMSVNGNKFRKEIRFGDFSDNLGCRMVLSKFNYYLSDCVEPFKIDLISSATTNISDSNINCVLPNNNGDLWIGSDAGLFFYHNKDKQTYIFKEQFSEIKNFKVFNIIIDNNSNMYLNTSEGVYVSADHNYFFRLVGDLPSNIKIIEIDLNNNLYIGSNDGLYIINTKSFINNIIVTKENILEDKKINISNDSILKIDTNKGLPSNNIIVIRFDANNVAWIGTEKGLVRYYKDEITIFDSRSGLDAIRVNDIAIRNTAIRYIATSSGVYKMLGISLSLLNFENTNAPIASIDSLEKGEILLPVFNNAKAVKWRDPNILWIASNYNIYQITFVEENFSTQKVQISTFSSSDFTLINRNRERNDDLQVFRLVGLEESDVSKNTLFEVSLNGNKITRGYIYSPEKQLIKFNYPLFESDYVKVNVRKDIEKIADFKQNKAEQIAVGNKITNVNKILSFNNKIYALTGGDVNTVQVNDETSKFPFDRIVLDTTPPNGKIRFGNRRDRTTFEMHIDPYDPYGVFDATSGIDKMIISNYSNFTSDGEKPLEPILFSRFLLHNIGDIFNNVTKELSFSKEKGRVLLNYSQVGSNNTILVGTGSPASIFKYNLISKKWDLLDSLDTVNGVANLSSSVEFLIQYRGRIYAGTGNDNGVAKVWIMNDSTNKFELIRTLPGNTHAYCSIIFDDVLYIGAGGGSSGGSLYSFDGTSTNQMFTNISSAIYDIVEIDREIYAATGSQGRIYKLDPKNKTQTIVDTNADRDVLSINKQLVNGSLFIFAGMGSSGEIRRSRFPDGAFINSFKTISSSVNAIKNINGVLYAAVGNVLYAFENVWTAKYTSKENIRDICEGADGAIWFISDSSVYKISKSDSIKRVYMKLIDKAGNETNLYTNATQSVLNPNFFAEINIANLSDFINKNRILRVDSFGNSVSVREGNSSFYSANIIDEEIGEYYSEIFNASNTFVSWNQISWESSVPLGTELQIQVRTASSKDALLNSDFLLSINGRDGSADISFLSGQYIQFKVVMKSRVRNLSPSLKSVVIKSVASDSVHFFTTNFVLPSRIKSGIVTSTKLLPVAADVVFGINTNNSVSFADYQIVDENRIFTTSALQSGNNLRVGIRFITPTRFEPSDFLGDPYGPYGTNALFNAIEWNFVNPDAKENTFNFKVYFYDDVEMKDLIYLADSSNSVFGFSADGEIFSTGGERFISKQQRSFSFTPTGANPLKCSTYYYIKVEAYNSQKTLTVLDGEAFIQSCGSTFVDNINFDFNNNSESSDNYHFRIRFYNNAERTDLQYTAFSANDFNNWSVNGNDFGLDGVFLNPGKTASINYKPILSNIEPGKLYYLSIDVYDGNTFSNNSNSFTFRANDLNSNIYCGSYSDVPVVKNFSIMFELENNEFVNFKVNI